MAPNPLSKFQVEPDGEDFQITVTDEAGGSFTVTATAEQLDVLVDQIDDLLLDDDVDEDD